MWFEQFIMEIILLVRDLVRVVTLQDMTRSMTAPLVNIVRSSLQDNH